MGWWRLPIRVRLLGTTIGTSLEMLAEASWLAFKKKEDNDSKGIQMIMMTDRHEL
jgi:hypothetical protein